MTPTTAERAAKKTGSKKAADLAVEVEAGDEAGMTDDELAARRKAREQAETGEGVTRQTENGEQLQFSLVIGGALPTSSVLTLSAKQLQFVSREFQKGDVLQFTGELRIVEVGARDKKRGTQRFHKAIIDTLTIDGEDEGADE